MKQVRVDYLRCSQLSRLLRRIVIPSASQHYSHNLPQGLSEPDIRMFYFIVVAICHQTSPIGKPRLEGMINGELLFGWDYLQAAWMRAALADRSILTREWLLNAAPSDIVYILYDNERRCGSHITDPEGRALLLNDMGRMLFRDEATHPDAYYEFSGRKIRDTENRFGLDSLLSRFQAYGKDPVKKKLSLFLILMHRYGFWKYEDTNNLGAPVDYHEMRLHLRLGTVVIEDSYILNKVALRKILSADEDVIIREAVSEAIFKIAEYAGVTPPDAHNFFWNMARNCCRRDETHCVECKSHPALPERHEVFVARKRCVFSDDCVSAKLPHHDKLQEPLVDTDLY